MSVNKFNSFARALATNYGVDIKLTRTFKLAGGDVNKAYGIELSNGVDIFMKANSKENVDFFVQEANNLEAISKTNSIGTPEIIALGTDDGEEVGYSFLLLKYVPEDDKTNLFWENLARSLANMHKADTKEFLPKENLFEGCKFGFLQDNYIGRTKQINSPKKSWIEFFRDNRLVPQFKLAQKYFDSDEINNFEKLVDNISDFLIEPEKPSLLHGDLWSGNILCGKSEIPYLIDPACYVGNPETDIAMTELFGGFHPVFYSVYKEVGLLQDDYVSRRDLYNLYHVLNHVNLFGHSYLGAAKAIIKKYVE